MADPVSGLVSVMMPAYNAAAFIERAMASVLTQTYAQWELIVVDDGSTDGTARLAGQFTDARVRVIAQPNGGEASARNRALDEARGEWLAFLDADDQFLPQHLALTVSYLHGHAKRQGVYTDGYYLTPDDQRQGQLSGNRRGPFEGRLFEQLVRASDVFGPPICTVLWREVVQRHGLRFDTGIVIGPDWDFLTRFAEFAEFGYIAEPTCLYRVHQTNITRTTGEARRRLSLARCREKAIRLEGFAACSLETRSYAFYDLLVNLLFDDPDRQAAVTRWPQFAALPARERARLYRLMASQALARGVASHQVGPWLKLARKLDPANMRGLVVAGLYRLNPALCAAALRVRKQAQPSAPANSPFGKLA